MKKKLLPIFAFLLLSNILSAQTILKKKKHKVCFLKQITIPSAQPSFLISFDKKILQPNYTPPSSKQEKWQKTSLTDLLIQHEKEAINFELTLEIANRYSSQKDFTNAYIHYEESYAILKPLLKQYPDSFELAEKMDRLYTSANQETKAIDSWQDYLDYVPQDGIAWTKLAALKLRYESSIESAKQANEKAYLLDNTNVATYVNAIVIAIREFIPSIVAASQLENKADKEKALAELYMDTNFFDRAIKDTQSMPAQLGKDACLLIQVTLKSILEKQDEKIGTVKIKLDLDPSQKQIIRQLRNNAHILLEQKVSNPLFAHKVLTLTDILLNNPDQAAQKWSEIDSPQQQDIDIYNWLTLGHLLNLNYNKAAIFKQKAAHLSPSYEDFFSLARLYIYEKNYPAAVATLDKALIYNPNDYRAFVTKVAIYFQQEQWQKGIDLMNTILPSLANNEQKQHLYYYQTLSLLLQDKLSEARPRLEQLQKDGNYTKEATTLLQKFY